MRRGLYSPRYPETLAYMLQSAEYDAGDYFRWWWRTKDFRRVMYRRQLRLTRPARMLLLGLRLGMFAQLLVAVGLAGWAAYSGDSALAIAGLIVALSYPVVWALGVMLAVWGGTAAFVAPRRRRLIAQAERVFAQHPGIKIAVAGSFGKTTMKELLRTVLAEGKKVAATPGNKNVALAHAQLARMLEGDEDVVIIEYGEGAPGDVRRFAANTHPNVGVITGLAPAHLDRYKTLMAAGRDIFSLAEYLHDKRLYVNGESPAMTDFVKPGHIRYSAKGVQGWAIDDVRTGLDGTTFQMRRGSESLRLKSGLIGQHLVGPLGLVAVLGLELGLTPRQVEAGVAKTKPFEHRMQPRQLHGAWIIDDTYNGNLEGIKSGLALLGAVSAKRKIYVTPGLVGQGTEAGRIHHEIGRLIAHARPDIVVLMRNSAATDIRAGLDGAKYQGDVRVEADPLSFYTNLDQFVAAGDVVLMQNDWTDNYS